MQKKFITLCLMLICSASPIMSFNQKSDQLLAYELFCKNIAISSSPMSKEQVFKLVDIVIKESRDAGCDEKRVMRLIIGYTSEKVVYYRELVKKVEAVWSKKVYAGLKLVGAALMVCSIYAVWELYREAPNKIEECEKKLKSLGATHTLVTGSSARAWYHDGADVYAIQKELRDLHRYHDSACLPNVILASVVCAAAVGMFLHESMVDLRDALYAKSYFERYCFIVNELRNYLSGQEDA